MIVAAAACVHLRGRTVVGRGGEAVTGHIGSGVAAIAGWEGSGLMSG